MDKFRSNWNKESPKFRQTLQQKLMVRGVEPTYDNCRNYWYGRIRPYKNPRGNVEHMHIRDIKIAEKRERRNKNGPTRPMAKRHRHKKRRFR
jgi:hypothetical protein